MLVAVVSSAGTGCATLPAEAPVADVRGIWIGHIAAIGGLMRGTSMALEQSGRQVIGRIVSEGVSARELRGTVTGQTLILEGGGAYYHATVAGERIDGMAAGFALPVQFTMVRKVAQP
jgi:hypothetical protein